MKVSKDEMIRDLINLALFSFQNMSDEQLEKTYTKVYTEIGNKLDDAILKGETNDSSNGV